MWRGMFNVAAASALYCLLHSALANDWTKEQAVRHFGQRAADAWYRPIFNAQAVIFLLALAAFIRRQPGRDVYHATGVLALLLRLGQAAGVALLAWAVLSVGLDHLTGKEGVTAWWQGAADVPRMPDGQEPSPAADGSMRTDGPLKHSRHPMNWALLPLFWLNPRMTTRLLAFNLVLTAYVFLGSLHAEVHTARFYGAAYHDYQQHVPFFAPEP